MKANCCPLTQARAEVTDLKCAPDYGADSPFLPAAAMQDVQAAKGKVPGPHEACASLLDGRGENGSLESSGNLLILLRRTLCLQP